MLKHELEVKAGSNDHRLTKVDQALQEQRNRDRELDRARKRVRLPAGYRESTSAGHKRISGPRPDFVGVTEDLAAQGQALCRVFSRKGMMLGHEEKAVRAAAAVMSGIWLPILADLIAQAVLTKHQDHILTKQELVRTKLQDNIPRTPKEIFGTLALYVDRYKPLVMMPKHIDEGAISWALGKYSPAGGGGRSCKLTKAKLAAILESPAKLAAARKSK